MTAKDIISINTSDEGRRPTSKVDADMSVFDVIPVLMESVTREIGVTSEGEHIGYIDQASLLEGISRMIASRDDCCVVTIECDPQDYSASALAHAVEDTDAHLVDLLSVPADGGKIKVALRIRHSDPSAAARSLERYGYDVVETIAGQNSLSSLEIATERLLSLQALMNV